MVNEQELVNYLNAWKDACNNAEAAIKNYDMKKFWKANKESKRCFRDIQKILTPNDKVRELSADTIALMQQYTAKWQAVQTSANIWIKNLRQKIHGKHSKRQITYAYNHTTARSGRNLKITIGGKHGS